jgi:hypothetical protein
MIRALQPRLGEEDELFIQANECAKILGYQDWLLLLKMKSQLNKNTATKSEKADCEHPQCSDCSVNLFPLRYPDQDQDSILKSHLQYIFRPGSGTVVSWPEFDSIVSNL